ncbi:alpha-L-rhamnosidase [Streptomyces mirabilis]|uniref:alpha-L-rhamnosidase n=1 Tax=Streptomyces mirabilis TaxID=68239 RepID=UPI0036CAC085
MSRFATTILEPADWVADWIEPEQKPVTREAPVDLSDTAALSPTPRTPVEDRLHPSPLVRQVFTLGRRPEHARLYITAHGVYEVTVNGQQITQDVLAPGYDEHPHRLSYHSHDAAPFLRVGENVVGVRLADGWWAGRNSFTGGSANYGDRLGVLWQLDADGEVVAASGPSARSSFGEIRYSDIFVGEKVDARLAVPGWDEPGFEDADWTPVRLADARRTGLVPFIGEPVRRVAEIRNPRILTTPKGELVVDLGQNIAGRLRLTASGASGTTIVLEHTESLDRNGDYQQNIMGANKDQTDVWILSGTGRETFEPRFSFHGFRFVRITGHSGPLAPEDVVGVVISSDLEQTGSFSTDDARINRLHENVVWSQRSNFLSIPTDCPQRERAGWTGDIQVFARAATNNARVDLFLERWLANVRAAQSPEGVVPMIVPFTPSFAESMGGLGQTSAGWGDVITVLPLALYERYGDMRVLTENYEAMRRWVHWVRERAEGDIPERYRDLPGDDPVRQRQSLLWNTGFHFGDWLVPSTVTDDPASLFAAAQSTGALFGSAFYFHSVSNLTRVAEILGDGAVAAETSDLAARIREAFIAEFTAPDGRMSVPLQGAYVIALAFGLVPDDAREAAGRHLVRLIHEAGDHLDTGFLSGPFLLDVLADLGETELAYTLLFQDSAPSWLYEVDMGATTIWESWTGVAPDGQPRELSLNHYAFGAVDDFLFRRVAGIRPAAPGYSTIEFAPDLSAPFGSVSARIGTPFGAASARWTRALADVEVEVVVPGNAQGVLRLPGREDLRLPPGRHTFTTRSS